MRALDTDGDDGRLSQFEYEQALEVLVNQLGVSSSQLDGLDQSIMESGGEAICLALRNFGDISEARDSYREFVRSGMTAEEADTVMKVSTFAAASICSSLIESLS